MSRVLSYEEKDTWIHRLSGVTKLLCPVIAILVRIFDTACGV